MLEDYHLGQALLLHLKRFISADSIDVGSFGQEKGKTKQFIMCRNCAERSQCRVLPPKTIQMKRFYSHVNCQPLLSAVCSGLGLHLFLFIRKEGR